MRRPYSPLTKEEARRITAEYSFGTTVFPSRLDELSVYIHIPFCSSRCRYCDFYFETGWSATVMARTLQRILEEARFFMKHCGQPRVRTLYIGGGTPSVIPVAQLAPFLQELSSVLQLSTKTLLEWSFEANPENISPELLQTLISSGVTRLSIGVQTFSDRLLKTLTRRAYSYTIEAALDLVNTNWVHPERSYSIDLISGIPTQTIQDIQSDIALIEQYQPQHVSHYTLTVEPATPLHQMIERGDLQLPNQDLLWEAMDDGLANLGYLNYEVSNYAKDNHWSKHNTAYWNMNPYIGLGPGAVGTIAIETADSRIFPARLTNPDLFRYSAPSTRSWLHEVEPLSAYDLFIDYCITGLRTIWGIPYSEITAIFGKEILAVFDTFKKGQEHLFDDSNPDYLRCTPQGRLLQNSIIRQGLRAVEESGGLAKLTQVVWPPSAIFSYSGLDSERPQKSDRYSAS